MNILPVLDLLDGMVVRGVAGKRESYRPIRSMLTNSSKPLEVAQAIRERFHFSRFYVADLDAILYERPNLEVYRDLIRNGFEIWVDAGIQDVARAQNVEQTGVSSLIVGLESITSLQSLKDLMEEVGPQSLIFSLDLKSGVPLVRQNVWDAKSPLEIARDVLSMGIERMIVLDLAQVGVGTGISTLPLCRQIRGIQCMNVNPLEIITGGGVNSAEDIHAASTAGVDGLLIASALHDGRLHPEDIDGL